MAARTVVCPECAEPVTVGRLSCPKCGSLLASVAGAAPATDAAAPVTAGGRSATSGGGRQSSAARAAAALRTAPPRSASVAAPPDETAIVDPDPEPVPGATRTPRRRLSTRLTNGNTAATAAAPTWPTPDGAPHSGTNGAAPSVVAAAAATNGSLVPRRDDDAARPGLSLRPSNRLGIGQPNPFTLDQAAAATTADGAAGPAWPAHPAGAYLPPSAVFGARTAQPVSADTLRARRGAASANAMAAGDDLGWSGDTEPAGSSGGAPAALADDGLLASLPFDVPTTVADWLVAAGSAVAAIGFLLPWSENVIGAKGIGTYLDAWGLASPPNVIVFLLALGALALTVIPNRVPVWVRTGTLGLLLGGVLLGLVWPYLVGGWAGGAQVGVLGETVASVLLIVGGVLVQRAMRHGGVTPAV